MTNRLFIKTLIFLSVIGIESCRTNTKIENAKNEDSIEGAVVFNSENEAFTKYISNFNEVLLPFDFKVLWKEIGAKIKHHVDKKLTFFNNEVVQGLIIDKSSQAYCAYKIPFNEKCIGLVYTIQDDLNHQVVLVTYNSTGKAISGINIHGEFNDSEYKLNGFIDSDFTVSVYDSAYFYEDKKLQTRYKELREYLVKDNGEIVSTQKINTTTTALEEIKETDLIGIWHDAPVVSSGLGSTITFYPDKSYRDRVAEGGRERYVYTKGTWEIIGEIIQLTPIKDGVFEGGEVVYDVVAGDSVLEGATIVERKSNSNVMKLTISSVSFNEDFNKKTVRIGKGTYYKLDDDPSQNYWGE